VAALKKKRIIVSEKDGYVRAGVHVYNDEDDIDRLLNSLAEL
jgi:selenocysteine lyase/cysteine desulfurase